jgi:hypothetical protein
VIISPIRDARDCSRDAILFAGRRDLDRACVAGLAASFCDWSAGREGCTARQLRRGAPASFEKRNRASGFGVIDALRCDAFKKISATQRKCLARPKTLAYVPPHASNICAMTTARYSGAALVLTTIGFRQSQAFASVLFPTLMSGG